MSGLLGKKIRMTQIFDESGRSIPVTVINAGPCYVSQIKTVENDGYRAVQVGFGDLKEKHAKVGHLELSIALINEISGNHEEAQRLFRESVPYDPKNRLQKTEKKNSLI